MPQLGVKAHLHTERTAGTASELESRRPKRGRQRSARSGASRVATAPWIADQPDRRSSGTNLWGHKRVVGRNHLTTERERAREREKQQGRMSAKSKSAAMSEEPSRDDQLRRIWLLRAAATDNVDDEATAGVGSAFRPRDRALQKQAQTESEPSRSSRVRRGCCRARDFARLLLSIGPFAAVDCQTFQCV